MSDLFLRTASQGLQAFLPVAFALTAFRRRASTSAVSGVWWGIAAATVATVPAGLLFQQSVRQALWEAVLALLALGSAAWLILTSVRSRDASRPILAAITVLFVTRQTMEVASVFTVAAFQLRSFDAVTAIGAAMSLAIALAAAWWWMEERLRTETSTAATRAFLVLYVLQLALYAFHESAEARLLPWSDVLHAATEPYGPDGVYGLEFSWLLVAAPLAAAAATAFGLVWPPRRPTVAPRATRVSWYAIVACALLVAVGSLSLRSADSPAPPRTDAVAAMTAAPYVLFRHTGADQDYDKLTIVPLSDPASGRVSLGMPCERVAFRGERGICLQAMRGAFTTYRGVLFDRGFNTLASWTLDGSPSRTRVAPDGRVGAITVFVTGHGYGSTFSTKTTLIDMASGDALGDLEQFATWRNGTRIKAQDVNYWSITFARDSNNFYATLGTGGQTYLVRGDLGLRKLTVVYEGVECPSLSPDERRIAFKKRVSTAVGAWRLAVLDLQTMTEHLVGGERRYVDDQAEWLDSDRLLYAVPRPNSAVSDVWMAPADGSTPARIFIPLADSPAVVGAPMGGQESSGPLTFHTPGSAFAAQIAVFGPNPAPR